MKPIGPSFSDELKAAGLMGLPFAWGADGAFHFDPRMTQTQIDAVMVVYTAHDPTRPDPQQAIERDGKLVEIDSMIVAEEIWRAKGTPDATARADRLKAEINRRKAELGVA